MLTDRTYLLFRPRTTLPNERLTIRSESGSGPMSTSSFGRLSHSSSFDRLPLSGTTSSIGPSGWINGHLSPSSTFGYRRSEYRSITPASPRLARRTMTFSSADLRSPSTMITSTSSSPNMEKREALMSSFARHTNSARTRPTLTTYHASPASTSPLPPRPKHSSFLAQNRSTNTMRSSPYISSSASNVLSSPSSSSSSLLRAHLQEYFRPTIRQRPQFSAIRKSVMQRSRPMYDTNRSRLNGTGYTSPSLANFSANSSISNNYSHHHNLHTHHHNSHCNGAMALRGSSSFASTSTSNGGSRRDSLMSAGSSLSRSSSSGSGCNLLNLADNSGIATVSAASNPSAASGESTPIELRGRSVRKVYRYRSVIKFQEHNIGQSLDERRQHINWDLESGLSNDLNGIGSSTAIDSVGLPTSHQTATASSSSATLSDCCTDFSFKSAVPALPNQLSKRTKSMPRKSVDDIKRHTWPQPKVNAFPYSNRLYVSEPNVNVKRISAALKKSDVEMLDDKLSVKMNESDSIETMTEPETVGEAIGNKSMRNKMEVKVKQILKSAGKAFTRKKTLSNDSSEASNESNKKAETSKRKAKTKVPRLVAKTDLKLESVKGEYVKATCLKEKTTESNQSTIQMDLPIISSHFNCIDWIEKQKIETICCSSDLLQTEFQSPEPVTFKVKLEQPLFCGSFVRPEVKIEIVRLDQPTMKSAYVPFPVQTVKSEWTCQLGDYHRPETIREITSIRLEALRTEFAYPDCVWSKTVWSPITTDLEFAFVSGSAQIERSNSSMKSHSASIGHVRTSIRNWPANRTSFQAPPLKLNSRLSNKPQSLESKACQQIPSIASTSTSIESSKACTSLVTDKPPKSKKKLKQNENRQAEPLSTCSIDFASQVAVSLSNSESSSNNERQSSHSKSTNMMLPLTRSPLQECNQQARSDRLIATARPIKSKRIQFRKYFVDDFVFRSVLGRGSFGKVKQVVFF